MSVHHTKLSDSETLELCEDWCTCGNPDPLREEHAHDCLFVNFPIEIMREVEDELKQEKVVDHENPKV